MGEASPVVIPIFGILDVTGEVIAMWIIIAVVAILSLIVTRNLKERPGKLQNMLEMALEYLENFFSGIIGKEKTQKYFTFLGSLFIFIILANYSGLIPGVGLTDYVKAPTASLSVTGRLKRKK
ncbi:MAG: F0F1 ATP synthase subunit A [Oscillospiraceae bacterium]|nr:F0F1 ATP synthase subunit A [Oscillospiraceae bacterium]